jgi:hypothetical protein
MITHGECVRICNKSVIAYFMLLSSITLRLKKKKSVRTALNQNSKRKESDGSSQRCHNTNLLVSKADLTYVFIRRLKCGLRSSG